MKIKFKIKIEVNGQVGYEQHEYEADSIVIVGKDDDVYRIRQDKEGGIEVTADGSLSDSLYVEPHVINQVTLIATNKI